MKKSKNKNSGFTLIELLVVIVIIGLLASITFASLSTARKKARDARRLSDVRQIQIALELYYNNFNQYPGNTDNDCFGWDTGYYGTGDVFISPLETEQTIIKVPGDPIYTNQCGGYRYYRYGPGTSGCDASKGSFYVLGITDMETSGNPYPQSPGWSCPDRNWQLEFDWVIGKFER